MKINAIKADHNAEIAMFETRLNTLASGTLIVQVITYGTPFLESYNSMDAKNEQMG